jgi:hypothetical protein
MLLQVAALHSLKQFNISGDLGINTGTQTSSPTQVGGAVWSKVASTGQMASTGHAVMGIRTDGTLWSWGYNDNGELGLNDKVRRSSPVQVGAATNWYNVFAAGAAQRHVILSN